MDGRFSSFMSLPLPLRAALVIASGGGLMAVVALLPGEARWILFIGLLAVAVVLAGYAAVLKWLTRRKAAPMERDIIGNTAAAPQGVSEPARRARLDDLRKNFEAGITKFRQAGKDLYGMPWFLVVGEPGAGKTEAIRHCNVGFPPGLQDRFQGAGGTINMNWWFTNHGVILDTAGRLMFEEVQAGRTNEWQEFLSLLGTHRYNCPINGMVLVISAESLIADTAEELERKGAKFAEQLDLVQRSLEVRFPVFVVVTKCDRIVGFREFFENLQDPQSQHQMLGWSNPLPLDEPFRPELLDQHMRTLLDHLWVRRLALLMDPVNTENPDARRTDQVDDLYAFPKHMAEVILPRLRRYMEMIFVAGAWSARPLFLRGIYFTSSMREGAALDAELAEAMGVPLESLPEGRVFTKDRAYFLRDLFLDKVFREKGLVTRATNATAQHRRRKVAVLASGFLTVALLFFLTGYLAYALHTSVGTHRDYWTAAAGNLDGAYRFRKAIVSSEYLGSTNYRYGGMQEIEAGAEAIPVAAFHKRLIELAGTPIKAPWIFEVTRFAVDIGAQQASRRAACTVFEAGVLRPVLEAARTRMIRGYDSPDTWDDDATQALSGLVRVEVLAPLAPDKRFTRPADADAAEGPLELSNLVRFALRGSPGDYEKYYDGTGEDGEEGQGAALQEALNLACGTAQDGWTWPFDFIGAGSEESLAAVTKGINSYVESAKSKGWVTSQAMEELRAAMERYQAAEANLLALAGALKQVATVDGFESFKAQLERCFAEAAETAKAHESFALRLGCDDPCSVSRWYETGCARKLAEVKSEFAGFRAACLLPSLEAATDSAAGAGGNNNTPGQGGIPEFVSQRLTETAGEMEKISADPGTLVLLRSADGQYQRFRMFVLAYGQMGLAPADGALAEQLGGIQGASRAALEQIQALRAASPGDERHGQAAKFAAAVCELGARKAVRDALVKRIEVTATIAQDIAGYARNKWSAEEASLALDAPVPFTELQQFDAAYHPAAAKELIGEIAVLGRAVGFVAGASENKQGDAVEIAPLDQGSLFELYRQQAEQFERYLLSYGQYWSAEVPEKRLAVTAREWPDFNAQLRNVQEWVVNSRLKKVVEKIAGAMEVASQAAGAVSDKAGRELGSSAKTAAAKCDHTLRTLENDDLRRQCQRVLASWQQVDQNVERAREDLLRLEPSEFRKDYTVLLDEAPDYLIEYYRRLGIAMLDSIASRFQSDSTAAAAEVMRVYGTRFPLGPSAAGGSELKLEEFNQCRAILARMAAPITATGRKAFATGARLDDREMDAVLGRLLTIQFSDARYGEWVSKACSLLRAVPEKGVICQVWVPSAQRQAELAQLAGLENKAASWIWTRASIARGKSEGKRVKIGEEANLGSVECPGAEPMALLFWQFGDEASPSRSLQPESLWRCVWMLHQRHDAQSWENQDESRVRVGSAERSKDNPKNWIVRIDLLDDANQLRVLWLELRFDQELPEINQWPALSPM